MYITFLFVIIIDAAFSVKKRQRDRFPLSMSTK